MGKKIKGNGYAEVVPLTLTIYGSYSALGPSVITQMNLGLLLSMGFNIGALYASVLILSKHLSNEGIHSNRWPFLTQPNRGVVYALISGM